jgi:hypothetical protein
LNGVLAAEVSPSMATATGSEAMTASSCFGALEQPAMMAIRVRQPTRGRAVIGMGMEPPGAACYA